MFTAASLHAALPPSLKLPDYMNDPAFFLSQAKRLVPALCGDIDCVTFAGDGGASGARGGAGAVAAAHPAPPSRDCAMCTWTNEPGAATCAMCDTPLN
jgi:hypothetical protein